MARTLFFRMVFRKFSQITKNKPIFSQGNIFYNYEYFSFQSTFWSLFNHRQRIQSNEEQCSAVCVVARLAFLFCCALTTGSCNAFQKKIGVLRPVFPDNIISCDYDLMFYYFLSSFINFEIIFSCRVVSKSPSSCSVL